MYALTQNSPNFYIIDLIKNEVIPKSANEKNYNLFANYEAFLLNISYDNFFIFASFTNDWYIYSSEKNKWNKLNGWEKTVDCSAHFCFDFKNRIGFYHIQGRDFLEYINFNN